MTHYLIAANDLRSGRLVYFAGASSWTPKAGLARRAQDEATLEALKQEATKDIESNRVTALRAVVFDNGAPQNPIERVGLRGPTVRRDLARDPGEMN